MKLIDLIDIQPQSVKWLFDLNHNGLLVVDDSFQRNYVWNRKNQIQLIESVLMGYPIPEIYIWNVGTDENTGDTKYSIVDGQQRTGALFQFISNQYKLTEFSLKIDSEIFERVKNKYFRELDVDDKKAIWSYIFSIRLVRNSVERDSIVKMFLRLNSNNLTLNPQELRNAEFQGEFMQVVSTLSERSYWDKNNVFSIVDRRRMRDISFISTLLIFMKQGIQGDITEQNINTIYDLYNDCYPDQEIDIKKFDFILNCVDQIIDGVESRQKFLKKSVHLYSIFTAIYEVTLDDKVFNQKQIENYREFIANYSDEGSLEQRFPELISDLLMYKSLVLDGTRAQSNRLKRHNIVVKILNS